MNLSKLFPIQKKLDDRIEKEKGLEGQDLLNKKILALLVELGELANEWRGFKFWSEDQEPRTNEPIECKICEGWGSETDPLGICMSSDKCESCNGTGFIGSRNLLLEEYVDCLHFILSIGLELGIKSEDICVEDDLTGATPTETFNELFSYVSALNTFLDVNLPATITNEDIKEAYHDIFECFVGLGESDLGFTREQIEQAYFEKNKVNHERQENGY